MRLLQSPVFYLVSSNLVFWGLPLLLIQLKARPVAQAPSPPTASVQSLASAALQEPDPSSQLLPPIAVEPAPAVQPAPAVVQSPVSIAPPPSEPPLREEPTANLMRDLQGAAGLGGPITLKSLKEPLMPIAARVERQQQKASGDSLAALPRHWRESLRQELPAAKPVSEAAVVRLPVPALKQRQEVPVIVNERGEGEALVATEDQRVRQAVEGWAARQVAASPGTVQVYVVAAEPLATERP